MDHSESIEQHIRKMYPNWLQQSERMCGKQGFRQEAEDVLQEVICYVFEHYKTRIPGLYEKKGDTYNALDGLIIRILELNICSPSATYRQKYQKNRLRIDRFAELNKLQIAEEKEADVWEVVLIALDKLHLTEYERQLFGHYFLENKKLCDWYGPESNSTASRICKRIVANLKAELKKDDLLEKFYNF